jgi:hypothetical protein
MDTFAPDNDPATVPIVYGIIAHKVSSDTTSARNVKKKIAFENAAAIKWYVKLSRLRLRDTKLNAAF